MSAHAAEGLLAQLPAVVVGASDGPPWLARLRREAAARLREDGFPTRRTEAWRFTPVAPVVETPFRPAPAPDRGEGDRLAAAWAAAHLGDDRTWRLAILNGRPQLAGASAAPDGVEVLSLTDALARAPERIEPHLGAHARSEHFAALNAALFEDGVVVRVRANAQVATPIHLVHVGVPHDGPTASYPRVLVLCEPGSQAQLIETFLVREGHRHLTNAVTEIDLGANAGLEHTRVNEGAANGYVIGQLAVHQQRDSRYASRVVTLGGALYRLDLNDTLDGEGAECVLDGVYHVRDGDHVNHYTSIDHAKPRCSSNETYRGVLDGTGHAVFDGTIVVRRDSQQTQARQENRNLLLSDDAIVNTKPHLEIDADDVSCSHGATIGALDDTQLFYLRARGIGHEQATAILTFSFVRELIDRIPHAPTAQRLAASLRARLPHGDTIQELME